MADGKLIFDTKVDTSGFNKGISALGSAGKKGMKIVNGAMIATAAAVGGIGVASIKVGMDFEEGMSNVKAISGATDSELEKLSKTARELGATTSFSATEAAEGMQYLAMAGFETNEIVDSMPGLLDLAAASGMELGRAADITSNIMSGFNIEARESGKVADVLAKASSSSNTDVAQLGDAMSYVAPVANGLGLSIEETAASIGILSDAGIQGSRAGTTLRQALTRLQNPVGGAKDVMNELGLSMSEVDPSANSLEEIISTLEKSGMDAGQAMRFFGAEAGPGMIAMLDRGSEGLGAFSNELENAEGTASKMASDMLDNLKGDITLFKSAIEGIGISIYENLNEPLRESVQWITGWAEALNGALIGTDDWREKLIETTGATGQFKSQLENLPDGAEGVAQMFGLMITEGLSKLASQLPEIATKAVEMIQSFADGINENKDQIGDSIATLATTAIEFLSSMYPIFIETGAGLVVSILTGIVDNAPRMIDAIVNAVNEIIGSVGSMLPELSSSMKEIISTLLEGIVEILPDIISFVIDLVGTIGDLLVSAAPDLLAAVGEVLKMLLGGIRDLIPILIDIVLELIDAIVDFIGNNLSDVVGVALEIVEALAKGLLEGLAVLVQAAMGIIIAIIDAIVDNIPLLMELLPELLDAIIDTLVSHLPKFIELAADIILALVDGIITSLPLIISTASELIFSLIEGIINMVDVILETGIEVVLALVEGLLDSLPLLVEIALVLITTLIEVVLGLIPEIITAAISLVEGLVSGLIEAIPILISKVPVLIEAIVKGLIGAIGLLISAAIELVMAIIQGLFKAIPRLLSAAFDLIVEVKDQFLNTDWSQIGIDIIKGIGNGILGMGTWLKDKAMDTVGRMSDGIKNVFKINSPSRLMEDEVGENIMLGISVGIEGGLPDVIKNIKRDMPDISKTIDGVVSGGQFEIGSGKFSPASKEREVVGSHDEFSLRGNVKTVVEIDGREIAKTTSPYMSEELELNSKRRR